MFKKVASGQAIEIKASEWNAVLAAAEAEINRQGGQATWAIKSTLPAGCTWAVNSTGKTIVAGDVVAVSGFASTPPDLISSPVVRAATPEPDDKRYIAVAVENSKIDAVFRVRLHGPALVKITAAPAAGEDYIGIGEEGAIVPAENGLARIVTSITSDDATMALVILGCGMAGEPPPSGMFQLVNATARTARRRSGFVTVCFLTPLLLAWRLSIVNPTLARLRNSYYLMRRSISISGSRRHSTRPAASRPPPRVTWWQSPMRTPWSPQTVCFIG